MTRIYREWFHIFFSPSQRPLDPSPRAATAVGRASARAPPTVARRGACECALIAAEHVGEHGLVSGDVDVALVDDRADHADEPEALASAKRTVRGIGGASTGKS